LSQEHISLTPQEVADILKITKNTVYELVKRGDIKAYHVGKKLRFDRDDVDAYIQNGKTMIQKKINLNNEHPTKQIDTNFVICGQDVILDILCRHLENHPYGVRALRSYLGSYNGLFAMYQGDVQVATCHLWDGESDSYNLTYVKRMLPGFSTIVIHLVNRMQGFYVKKGNPKNIKDWVDLDRSDITIVNRERGSGTRILMDEKIRLLKLDKSVIKGYEVEYLSHLAIASAIARGEADLGLGNEKTSLQVDGIDFIPLKEESYDLIIKKEDMDKPAYKAILEIIQSLAFKNEIDGLGGYNITDIGKIVGES